MSCRAIWGASMRRPWSPPPSVWRRRASAKSASSMARGFEASPELLERLPEAAGSGATRRRGLRAIKDPAYFFGMLDRLGLPIRRSACEPPAETAGWLVKAVGGAGGGHIRALSGNDRGRREYYQRRVAGRPVSCLFLADGREGAAARLQRAMAVARSGSSLPLRRRRAAREPAASVTRDCRGLEPLVKRDRPGRPQQHRPLVVTTAFALLEVNPRPGARSTSSTAGAAGPVRAPCRRLRAGVLPVAQHRAQASAMSVVYAEALLQVPGDIS